METAKKVKILGKEEVVIEPRLAECILQINKKSDEIQKLCKEVLDMIGNID